MNTHRELWPLVTQNCTAHDYSNNRVEAFVSGYSKEAKKVSVTEGARLQEWFSYVATSMPTRLHLNIRNGKKKMVCLVMTVLLFWQWKKEPKKWFINFFRSSKYDSFHIFQFVSFPASGILRTQNGLVSRCSSIDRALRLVIAKFRVRFPVKPDYSSVQFFFNRLSCSFNFKDHVHFHIFIRS